MLNDVSSRVAHIHLKQFRCFNERIISFDAPLVLIQGSNGAGKTSLLEALYYACYLRSFRASNTRELVADDADSFFIKLLVQSADQQDEINVGFSPEKKLVKINQQAIASYKELMAYYCVISVTEDDLALIKDGPTYRRDFLDQAIALIDAEYVTTFKQMRETIEVRNAALQAMQCPEALYVLWTQQLWDRSRVVQEKRMHMLSEIQEQVTKLIATYFESSFEVFFSYEPKKTAISETFQDFQKKNPNLYHDELKFKRSLFGAHLDDILITFKGKKSRNFASRGQQKLLVLLIKAAQIHLLAKKSPSTLIFLLDDFMTDFDAQKAHVITQMLVDLNIQLIFTSPLGGYLEQMLKSKNCQLVSLD